MKHSAGLALEGSANDGCENYNSVVRGKRKIEVFLESRHCVWAAEHCRQHQIGKLGS